MSTNASGPFAGFTGVTDPNAINIPYSNVREEPLPPTEQDTECASKVPQKASALSKPPLSTLNSTSESKRSTLELIATMTPKEIEVGHILVSMSRSGNTDTAKAAECKEQGVMTTSADEEAARTLLSLANADDNLAATRQTVDSSRTVVKDEDYSTDQNLDSIPVFAPQSSKKRQTTNTSETSKQRQTKRRRGTPRSPSAPALQHSSPSSNTSSNDFGANETQEAGEEVSIQRSTRTLRKGKADKASEVPTSPASPKRVRFSQPRSDPEELYPPQHTATPRAKNALKSSKSSPKSKSTGSSLPSLPVLGRTGKAVKESTAALLETTLSDKPTTSPEAAVDTKLASSDQTPSPPHTEPELQQEHSTATSTSPATTTPTAAPTETPPIVPRPRNKAPKIAVPAHILAKHAELMALRRSNRYPPIPAADALRDPKNADEWVVGAKAHTILLHPVPHFKLQQYLDEGQEQPAVELWFVNETTAPPGGVVLREEYVRRGKKRGVPIDFGKREDIRDLNKWVTQKLCRWECARVREDMSKRKYCDEEVEFLWAEARMWKEDWVERTGKADSELNRAEFANEMVKKLNERFGGKKIQATYNGEQDEKKAVRPPREAPGVDSILDRRGILKELGFPPSRIRSKRERQAEEDDVADTDDDEEL